MNNNCEAYYRTSNMFRTYITSFIDIVQEQTIGNLLILTGFVKDGFVVSHNENGRVNSFDETYVMYNEHKYKKFMLLSGDAYDEKGPIKGKHIIIKIDLSNEIRRLK